MLADPSLLRRAAAASFVLLRNARDVLPLDVMRLVHGLIMAENASPGEEGQSDRMLALVMAGLASSDQAQP